MMSWIKLSCIHEESESINVIHEWTSLWDLKICIFSVTLEQA